MFGFLLFVSFLPSSLIFLCFLLFILLLFSMPAILGFLNDWWAARGCIKHSQFVTVIASVYMKSLQEIYWKHKKEAFFLPTTDILASKQICIFQIFGTVRNLLEIRLNSRRKKVIFQPLPTVSILQK